jgi:site-specific DNA-methyltransferase (adenine-specific)
MAGGKGLDKYRERMLTDKRLRNIVDYPKLYEGFPGVKIRGGISYFLWDRQHNGPCTVQTLWDGQPMGPAVARHLDSYGHFYKSPNPVTLRPCKPAYLILRTATPV